MEELGKLYLCIYTFIWILYIYTFIYLFECYNFE
jgi:hypothetical protein